MRYLYALIVSAGLCVASSPSQAATGADNTSVSAVPSAQRAQATEQAQVANDKARYAERETKSGEAQDYRGGDTVVIGASAATAILAVLLLIVLI